MTTGSVLLKDLLAEDPRLDYAREAGWASPEEVQKLKAAMTVERHDEPPQVLLDLAVTDDWSIPPPPPREWIAPGWVPADRVTLLTGGGGLGKSRLAVMLAIARASGARRWFAHDSGPELDGASSHVVFASWEDEVEEAQRRFFDWPAIAGLSAPEALQDRLEDRLAYIDMAAAGPVWLDGGLTPVGQAVRAEAKARAAGLMILDPLAAAYGDNENDRPAVRAFMANWGAWAAECHCAIVIVGHPPKNAAAYSGSTDWRNAARAMLVLEDVDGRFRLSADKQSYGPRPDPLELQQWTWWSAGPWDGDEPDDELDEAILANLRRTPMNKTETRRAVGKQQVQVSRRIDALLARGAIRETIPGNRLTKYELSDSSDSKQ